MDGQHQKTMTAQARAVRAEEAVDQANLARVEAHQVTMMVHGAPTMEHGRPQDLARVNLGRAEVDQASRARAEEDQARVNQARAEAVDLRMKDGNLTVGNL